MKIEFDVTKMRLSIFIMAVFVMGGVIFAYAYTNPPNGGNPAVMGHSVNEIDWNQVIPGPINIAGGILYSGGVNQKWVAWTDSRGLMFAPINSSGWDYANGVYITNKSDICSYKTGSCLSQAVNTVSPIKGGLYGYCKSRIIGSYLGCSGLSSDIISPSKCDSDNHCACESGFKIVQSGAYSESSDTYAVYSCIKL